MPEMVRIEFDDLRAAAKDKGIEIYRENGANILDA